MTERSRSPFEQLRQDVVWDMASSIQVRLATKSDIDQMARALARAFWDDPLTSWLFPNDATRDNKLYRMFKAQIAKLVLPKGATYTTDAHAGAALWEPPGTSKIGLLTIARVAPSFGPIFGTRLPALFKMIEAIDSKHPREPSWYLFTLGTDPPHQGQGVGGALMSPVLDRCDTEGLPAYLESSKLDNIPFYERAGFRVTGEISIRSGPTVWPMWREPR